MAIKFLKFEFLIYALNYVGHHCIYGLWDVFRFFLLISLIL